MHAWLRCRWCGLPLACSTACATACSTALACLSCVAPWASARPSEGTWRVGVSDGVQSRTPYCRLRSLETSTAHASSPVTPRRVQPSRAAEPSVKAASGAPSPGRTPTDAGWPYGCGAQPRDTSLHTLCTSCCRALVSCGGARAYMRDVHARKRLVECRICHSISKALSWLRFASRALLYCTRLHVPWDYALRAAQGACQKVAHLSTSKLKELAAPPR